MAERSLKSKPNFTLRWVLYDVQKALYWTSPILVPFIWFHLIAARTMHDALLFLAGLLSITFYFAMSWPLDREHFFFQLRLGFGLEPFMSKEQTELFAKQVLQAWREAEQEWGKAEEKMNDGK